MTLPVEIDQGSAAITVMLFAVALAAILDLRLHRIPNLLTYPLIVVGIALGMVEAGWDGALSSLLGFGAAFVPSLLLFSLGSMGGGDVKLLGGVGAAAGYPLTLDILFYTLVAGTALGLIVLIWRGRFIEYLKGLFYLFWFLPVKGAPRDIPVSDYRIPFAPIIAVGSLWALTTPIIQLD